MDLMIVVRELHNGSQLYVRALACTLWLAIRRYYFW
jgi:hypothetical protein